jgi:DNA invertase Pin-like site-specific DNA recombinase
MSQRLREKVSRHVKAVGSTAKAARELGIGDATLSRFLADLPVRAGTLALLQQMDKQGKFDRKNAPKAAARA